MDSVDVPPTPHVPEPQEDALHPVKGTAKADPTLIWYFVVTVPPPVALAEAAAPASIVYSLVVVVIVIWYSPLSVSPPTALAPLYVTKSPSVYPPFASVTTTIGEPEVVSNGLVNVTVARNGVMSLYAPPFSM
jgi:hypothetical protein